MINKFEKAVKNRSSEILDSGKAQIIEDAPVEVKDTETKQSGFNINDIIEKTEKNSKNKTYYLEINVINEIKKISKNKGISESKLVNDVLKHILNTI